MASDLLVKEIYTSIQGESTFSGWPCVFIRLAGCDLRCSYCDTAYAFRGGRRMAVEEVTDEVSRLVEHYPKVAKMMDLPIVEVTGGEPLLQRPAVLTLLTWLCDQKLTVMLETSGAHSISQVDTRVNCIVDLKCPSSGEMEKNDWANIDILTQKDEIKFVIGTYEDYRWARRITKKYELSSRCQVLFSGVEPLTPQQADPQLKPVLPGLRPMSRRELAENIMRDHLPVRFQLQMHKFIWPADQVGV